MEQSACGRAPKPSLARALPTSPKKKPSGQMDEHQRLNRKSSASSMSGKITSSQPGCSSTNTRLSAHSVPNTSPMGHSRQKTGKPTAKDTTSRTARTRPWVLRLAPEAEAHDAQPAAGAFPLRPRTPRGSRPPKTFLSSCEGHSHEQNARPTRNTMSSTASTPGSSAQGIEPEAAAIWANPTGHSAQSVPIAALPPRCAAATARTRTPAATAMRAIFICVFMRLLPPLASCPARRGARPSHAGRLRSPAAPQPCASTPARR